MNKIMNVSTAQAEVFRLMANDRGITSGAFRSALDDGRVGKFLDTLKVDLAKLIPAISFSHLIVSVCFDPGCGWREMIQTCCPLTSPDSAVWDMDVLCPPTWTEKIGEEVILINSANKFDLFSAHAWAKSMQLKDTTPREVFAIGKEYPELHKRLRLDSMRIVATRKPNFGDDCLRCYVEYDGRGLRAGCGNMNRIDDLPELTNLDISRDWFAFRA